MSYSKGIVNLVKDKYPQQLEFHQAVQEVVESLEPLLKKEKKYEENAILERLVIPNREIHFRVTWVDDKGKVQVNRAMRIEFNSAIGPYKGGPRFHPSVESGALLSFGI